MDDVATQLDFNNLFVQAETELDTRPIFTQVSDALSIFEDGGGDLVNVLTSAFSEIEIAEDEIAQAQKRHPEKSKEIWESFLKLKPTPSIRTPYGHIKSEALYRGHCRELLERVAKGSKLKWPTAAEIIGTLCEASMRAPLNNDATYLYMRCFEQVYGQEVAEKVWGKVEEHYRPRESYPGASDEYRTIFNRRMSADR